MRRALFLLGSTLSLLVKVYGQETDDRSAIKLYVSGYDVYKTNADLPDNAKSRLVTKMTQLINETGVAEYGFSNFFVRPKLHIVDTSVDQSGIAKVYLAECELVITISRVDGENIYAVFNSFSKKIVGSGSTANNALANAVNNISVKDESIIGFLTKSRVKIDEYFKVHCNDVLKEADRLDKLKDYGGSIALYFSIPSNAGACYETARQKSIGVYVKYREEKCDALLLKLRSYIARGQSSENSLSKNYYDSALAIMSEIGNTTPVCIGKARTEVEKIEKKLDESQKRTWETEAKKASNTQELTKEMIRAMAKINSTYQPTPAGEKVIIIK